MQQVLLNILISLSMILLLANSFEILYNVSKYFHIAHAIIITIGAYLTYLFSISIGVNILLSILLSVLFTTMIGILIFLFIYKNFLRKFVHKWRILIASIGIYIILQNFVSLYFGDGAKHFITWNRSNSLIIIDAYITDVQLVIIISCVILIMLSWLFISRTIIGKEIRAVASNSVLSGIYGISSKKTMLYCFTLSSILASIAGILLAADTHMTPTMGFNWLLYAVVAMIISGMGKLRYLIFGSFILTLIQHLSAYFISSKWMDATAYIILIVFLIWKPLGFSGKRLKKTEI